MISKTTPLLLLFSLLSIQILGYTGSFMIVSTTRTTTITTSRPITSTLRRNRREPEQQQRNHHGHGRCRHPQQATGDATTPPPLIQEYNDFIPRPDPQYSALDVVSMCMDTLLSSSSSSSSSSFSSSAKKHNAGLEVCFAFSNDRCRAAIGGDLAEFQLYAQNPTFTFLVHCDAWDVVQMGNIIPGTRHRGSMQTILMRAVAVHNDTNRRRRNHQATTVQSSMAAAIIAAATIDNRNKEGATTASSEQPEEERQFLWTLQQERRPPQQDCWLVHEVLYVKNAFLQTL
jgi:hypothetical protein